MMKLMRADMYRILRTKSFYATVIGMVVLVGVIVSTQTMVVSGMFDADMQQIIESTKVWGVREAIMTCTMGLSVFSWFSIPIYSIVVGQEFSQGTYKNVFFSGISRKSFVISKLILIASLVLFMLLVLFGSASLFGYLNGGMGSLPLSSDIVKNLMVAGLFYVVIITVYYAIAMSLQVSVNSVVIAIVFVVVAPFLIQMLQMSTDWAVLNAVSFAATTFEAVSGILSNADIVKTVAMNIGVLAVSAITTTLVIRYKEF
ncbi:ABC transporter permease subunit [Erysipelothrix sp. HDW6C]|uniref:ABC transporter permease n=1 Tax=Erysipelothrix sp. HDW6C TaxID=2714930 RepID=UPI00140CDEFB|nr:ABC transporter permease [Erysipelothrix sp. HDW6C]QIK69162.1 ABC transporter permease subunit [Erysipelothrix sp. HDW6C]